MRRVHAVAHGASRSSTCSRCVGDMYMYQRPWRVPGDARLNIKDKDPLQR